MSWVTNNCKYPPEPGSHNLLHLNTESLEEALRSALKSVLGGPGSGVKPRAGFYNKLQREMEEHDQDLEKKYDEDLNVTLIFVSATLSVGLDGAIGT